MSLTSRLIRTDLLDCFIRLVRMISLIAIMIKIKRVIYRKVVVNSGLSV